MKPSKRPRVLALDVAWVAGLMEGEGSFYVSSTGQPKLSIMMSDKDVLERLAELFGTTARGPYGPYGRSKKQVWQVTLCNTKAASWMMTIYALMGERRKEKIKEVLDVWKRQQMVRPGRSPSCHPERDYEAKGKCKPCYMKEYHATH